MNVLNRTRLAAVAFTLVLSMPAVGQVFVRTVLDRKPPTPAEQLSEVEKLAAARLAATCNSGDPLKDMECELDTLYNTQSLPNDEEFKKKVNDTCSKYGYALTNRSAPVAWNSARSVCFWNQPGLEFAKAAQIVGGDSQGTASVEVASDVFWGLRVRVQTSVAGTDSSDPDGQAKALLKQLQTAGGNISIGATYPWYALERSPAPVASSNSDPVCRES
jgi:hypothetical protein